VLGLIKTEKVWRSWKGSVRSDSGGLAPPWCLNHSLKFWEDGSLSCRRTSVGRGNSKGIETKSLVLVEVGHIDSFEMR
jgi:hypothetical protein